MALDIARATGRAVATSTAGRFLSPALLGPAVRGWVVGGLAIEAEQRRLFPWLAVAFGAGILVFFTATDGMPSLWAPLAAAGGCAATLPFLGARPAALAVALALIAALLGFSASALRVSRVAAPVLTRTTIAPLSGLIESLEEREEGARLVVWVTSLGTMAAAERPLRVRVSFKKAPPLRPGDFITATARLLPPPEAARPGGYDFARDAYFRGIGAVGSLLGKIAVTPSPTPVPWSLRLGAAVDDARNALTRRITDANGGQAGAVAAALVTGKRGLIAPATNDTLRAAGIYHVVSISGLHMVLAAGVVFWLVRAGLALVPFLALAWPIKKIAAGLAMVGVTAYCVFSGWDIAAERSLVMTLIMLGAILVDRPALSMRNLALAALIALAHEPEGLLGPSFQMSFGAVAGLIACARLIDGRMFRRDGAGRIGRLIALASTTVVGTLGTTLVAQVATAPFGTYHFQTVQPFGLIGNALTLPLVSLAVMPAAVLGIIAYPFALDQPVWWLMGLAVRGMLTISGWIQGLGRANVVVPAFGTAALGFLAAGLLLATLPVSRLRWLALPPLLVGLGLAALPARYDIYVDRQGSGAAVRGADGRLVALGRPSNFVLEQWLKADGDGRPGAQAAGGAVCDRIGCTLRLADGRAVALLKDRRGFAQDCANAAVLITPLAAPPGCAAALVIDRAYLAAHGAVAVRLEPDGFALADAHAPGRAPPWRAGQAATSRGPPVSDAPPPAGDAEPKRVPFQGMTAPPRRAEEAEPPPDEPAPDGPPSDMPPESLQ